MAPIRYSYKVLDNFPFVSDGTNQEKLSEQIQKYLDENPEKHMIELIQSEYYTIIVFSI